MNNSVETHAPPLLSWQLLLLCVGLPAAIVAIDQWLRVHRVDWLLGMRVSTFVFPWMVVKVALVSGAAGRFVTPRFMSWLVFAWCLLLVDLNAITASHGDHGHRREIAETLITAEIGLVTAWAVLGRQAWYWRLPAVLLAAAAVNGLVFSFYADWSRRAWPLLHVGMAIVMLMLCVALRLAGYRLERADLTEQSSAERSFHFGIRHMLIWSAAMAPLLVLARGWDALVPNRLGLPDLFPAAVIIVSVSCLNIVTIWATLGSRRWWLALCVLPVLTFMAALGLEVLSKYCEVAYGRYPRQIVPRAAFDMQQQWLMWLGVATGLLAALLLFLRASDYRLVRRN